MAADMVTWENLERSLASLEITQLHPLRDMLQDQVRKSQGLVACLESRDHIHCSHGQPVCPHDHSESEDISEDRGKDRLENLAALLHQADDLLDEILTFDNQRRHRRSQTERNESDNRSQMVQQVVNVIYRSTQEVTLFLTSSNQLVIPKRMSRGLEQIIDDITILVGRFENENDDANHGRFENEIDDANPGRFENEIDDSNPRDTKRFENIEYEPAEDIMIGRDDDKKKIINMLLQPPKDIKSSVSVICMSGVPGVGKSALAKDVYEDYKVRSHFDLKIWISVSQITDETEIIREIVQSCTNRRPHYHNSTNHQDDRTSFRDILGCRSSSICTSSTENSTPQEETEIYKRRLKKEIRGKLCLLVLDDVAFQKWHSLRDLLNGGRRGSQILMTTRLAEVADVVKKGEIAKDKGHQLHGLTKQYAWGLFSRLLKRDHLYEFSSEAEMKKIGVEIAKSCKNVPFTIKVAARFLLNKTKEGWLSFQKQLIMLRGDQDKDPMEDILHLSYSELPTRLRACFGYCSLFPQDFIFNRHDLINLWIAQGFVNLQDGEDGQSLKEVGEMYFKELSRRCLFEQVSLDELENILTCKMHPIVGDLAAKFTAGVFNIPTTDSGMIEIPKLTSKHVSLNCRGCSSLKFSSRLLEYPSIRTLMFVKEADCHIKVNTLECHKLLSSCRKLRVLDLHNLGLTKLPNSIGEQIHLRYLDLSKNADLVTLPNSFTRLYNLQTLNLNSCRRLKILPRDIGMLVNLKHFEIDGCDSLTCMPLSLGKLTQLEMLSRFVVGNLGTGSSKQTACGGLKELSELTMLEGRLALELTGDWVTDIPEAKQALCDKRNLDQVKISWPKRTSEILRNKILERGKMSANRASEILKKEKLEQKKMLENLKPNSNLKSLCIEGYKGDDFPSWTKKGMVTSLPNLVIISIEGCGECKVLPPFGKLPNLKKLTLRHMANVQFIEDVTSLESPISETTELEQDIPFFKSLQELTLHNFYKLEGWTKEVASIKQTKPRSFPCLTTLRIWNCPELTSFPLLVHVKDLNLQNTNHLLFGDRAKRANRAKRAKRASRLRNISHTSQLQIKNLQIKDCRNLESLRRLRNGLGGLRSLDNLKIESCNALLSLATDIGQIPFLEKLKIFNCKELDLCNDDKVPNQIIPRSPWAKLTCLRELKLRELPKLVRLPEGLKHVKTLKQLWISACPSFESMPEWISSLGVLQHLRIENCRALKQLPEELKNITSLMKVEIIECPELMQRCREPKGEDWYKIKHARVLLHKSRRYGYV